MVIVTSKRVSLGALNVLVSLLIPGAAFALKQHYVKAFLVPACGLAWVICFALSRLIIEPRSFLLMNAGLLTIHLGSIILALRYNTKIKHSGAALALIGLTAVHFCIVIGGHLNKATIFGFELYHIPSPSMTPTLAIGDIILVDTWAKTRLNRSDIVVFKRSANSIVLVKRVNELRNDAKEMYVLGDNPPKSSDSRRFGWVSTEFVQGRVTAALFNIRGKNSNTNTYSSYPHAF